jgi:hypothetical protein
LVAVIERRGKTSPTTKIIRFRALPPYTEYLKLERRQRLVLAFICQRKEISAEKLIDAVSVALKILEGANEERVNEFCYRMIELGGFTMRENEWVEIKPP